jgi:iron complex outermembrane receptor protein
VDALSAANAFEVGNPHAFRGAYDVTEGFFETVVPLLKDVPFAKQLDFNGAVRATDYSTSGLVVSWKAGLSYSVNDEIRFRATHSRDIRAPSLAELYTGSAETFIGISDPVKGVTLSTIPQFASGSTKLTPEQADTNSVGVVYEPKWAPGLELSLDYFNIDLENAITTLTAQNTVNLCYQGNTAACADVVRDSSGNLLSVNLRYINIASIKTFGFDIEGSYTRPLSYFVQKWLGVVSVRAFATNVEELNQQIGTTAQKLAGDVATND